jgi:hypothetical protein
MVADTLLTSASYLCAHLALLRLSRHGVLPLLVPRVKPATS